MFRQSAIVALLLLTACSQSKPVENAAATGARPPENARLLPLAIRTGTGDRRFDVEVARSPEEQEQGLMFRKSLDPDGGMLFLMDPPRVASFWMKNTLIPLDMLFIRTDGTIAFLKSNATPYSREPVSAGLPVAAVLELRGGRAAELGIQEGDRVRWGRCADPDSRPEEAWRGLDFCPTS